MRTTELSILVFMSIPWCRYLNKGGGVFRACAHDSPCSHFEKSKIARFAELLINVSALTSSLIKKAENPIQDFFLNVFFLFFVLYIYIYIYIYIFIYHNVFKYVNLFNDNCFKKDVSKYKLKMGLGVLKHVNLFQEELKLALQLGCDFNTGVDFFSILLQLVSMREWYFKVS